MAQGRIKVLLDPSHNVGAMPKSLGGPNPSLHPLNTARGLGECCKLPQQGLGRSPRETKFGAY